MSARTVPLTDDQYDRLWKDTLSEGAIGRVLAHAIQEIADQVAIAEVNKWKAVDELAKVCPGERVTIDWINRQLVVTQEPTE